MNGTGNGDLTSKYMTDVLAVLTVVMCALWAADAIAAPTGSDASSVQLTQEVSRLLAESDKAVNAGNMSLALIELKNAVRLAPNNGEIRARLGVMILRSGEVLAAERELRQALNDKAPAELVVPPLLRAMLQRNELKELLAEFPDPPQRVQDKTSADILLARSTALQASARPVEARAALDRSLGLRRDAAGLVMSARLAQQQGDLARARNETDEALKLAPTDEGALSSNILIARETGDMKKALVNAVEFVRRVPGSTNAKVLRIEVLLELKQDARAKQEVDALLMQGPNLLYGRYFRGVLMARAKDFKGAWRELQSLPPEFVQSDARIAIVAAGVAAGSGNAESGGAILTTVIANHPENREARLQLAALRLGQNSPQAAIDTLASFKASNDPAAHTLLAQAYLRLRRYDEAIKSLEIANASPNASDLLKQQLALSQLRVGEAERGIEGLRELTERNPGNDDLAASLIAALMRASKWDEALGVADGMAKRLPKSPLPAFYRGQIFVARGRLSEAETAFDNALALDPKFVLALYYRATVLIARGNPEQAKKDLQLILVQNPTNMVAYMQLTKIATDSDQNQEVLALLNRAMKAAPSDPTPRLALANYLMSQKKFQDAQATVSELLQISRNNPEGLALQGQIQLLRGQTTDAIRTFRALAAANPTSPAAYGLLARALYATKDQAGAEESEKRAIELAPDSAQIRSDLIDLQIGGGKGENALATARTYASAYPGPSADLLLAKTLVLLKRSNEAEVLLDKSLSSKPDVGVALLLAQIAMSSGNSKKAISTLANWVAKNPDDFGVRSDYAAMMMEMGDSGGARREYETLLRQHAEDPIILNNLGWLLQKDNPDRALSLVSLAAKVAPRSPQIADTLGWMKYQRRDLQGALPLLQHAHNVDSNSAPISYHLALVLDATGKRAEAKTLLQATLAKSPKFDGSDDARQTLARW